jgi:hypothetical protein
MKPQVALIAVVFVGLVGAIAFSHFKKEQQKSSQQAAAVAAGPPAGAAFLEREQDEQAVMMTGVRNTRKPGESAPAVSPLANYWIAEPGWEGVVEQMTDEKEGPALRWQKSSTGVLGGNYWVIVVLAQKDPRVSVGSRVWVQGRIENAETIMNDNMPTPIYRVIVKDARVLSVQ